MSTRSTQEVELKELVGGQLGFESEDECFDRSRELKAKHSGRELSINVRDHGNPSECKSLASPERNQAAAPERGATANDVAVSSRLF